MKHARASVIRRVEDQYLALEPNAVAKERGGR